MILKSLKLFLQNVWKNKAFMNCILETNKDFDILFIQEPPLSFVCIIPSSSNKDRNWIVGVPNHPNWITFFRPLSDNNNHLQVISYINVCFSHMWFCLRKDIINHKDISLKYLKDTEVNLYNVLIIARDFNIRYSDWNPSYLFHSIHSDSLLEVADSLNFKLSSPIQQVSVRVEDSRL